MSDAGWQEIVLRDMGVSQRGLAALDAPEPDGAQREPAPRPAPVAQPEAAPPAPSGHPGGPTPGDGSSGAEPGRGPHRGDPLLVRMGRGVRKAVGGSGASGGHARTQAETAEMLRRPVPGLRRLTVVSVRGGAGKTTLAALLATELSRHRTDRVLAVDADAELGSLPPRLGVRTEGSPADLVARRPRTFEEAAPCLARAGERLWVLSAARSGRIAERCTPDVFEAALGAVAGHFAAAVVDCGSGVRTDLHRSLLAGTHGLVLVTPGTVDGALSAGGALEWLRDNGRQALLRRTVVATVTHAPRASADLDRAEEMLGRWGLPVVHVPYDRRLALGGAVDAGRLSGATGTAVGRIAYEVFARAIGAPEVGG
ncbi:hypothetical protein [Actinomadura sp. NBRC 104425]|uniref:AAA family ATPase n=1 Tax=Actinomadura sp. NBRC 104425 TaxID=3032204 RepID=UPI002554AD41|nr:hypothetical protein [Actinomadura sp. NBRC 104425]